MLTNNFGVELIAATTKHSISGTTGTTGTIGKLASTWVLPPTLTLQYHFAPEAKVRPYVGAGVNWTLFYKEKASNGLEAAVGQTNVNLSSSFGWAAQAGIVYKLSDKVEIGANYWLLAFPNGPQPARYTHAPWTVVIVHF
jgi:outer membrane protein